MVMSVSQPVQIPPFTSELAKRYEKTQVQLYVVVFPECKMYPRKHNLVGDREAIELAMMGDWSHMVPLNAVFSKVELIADVTEGPILANRLHRQIVVYAGSHDDVGEVDVLLEHTVKRCTPSN